MRCPGCKRKLIASVYISGVFVAKYCPYCNKEIPAKGGYDEGIGYKDDDDR